MTVTWNSPKSYDSYVEQSKKDEAKNAGNAEHNVFRWARRKVLEYDGSLSEIRQKIPEFERAPFRTNQGTNKYMDVIVRKPLKDAQNKLLLDDDEAHIPVAIVSTTYGLIQHQEVFDVLTTAFKELVPNPQSLKPELMIMEYGELMMVSFGLHHCDFDPGDGETLCLKVNALNSVNASTTVNIDMTWYRHSSGTSLMYQLDEKLKKRHVRSLKPEIFERFLQAQLLRLDDEHGRMRDWYKQKVSSLQVSEWISEIVTEKWGKKAADRVLSIAKDGQDGQYGRDGSEKIPGKFAPARNLYHLSQVLSWVAKWTLEEPREKIDGGYLRQRMIDGGYLRQRRFERQLELMKQIPALMNALLSVEESPTIVQ